MKNDVFEYTIDDYEEDLEKICPECKSAYIQPGHTVCEYCEYLFAQKRNMNGKEMSEPSDI